MIPKPRYSLINTSIGGDAAVVVVNAALRTFTDRQALPWHLRISIDCKQLSANGMPTIEEDDILQMQEAIITPLLQSNQNAVFLARITSRGERVLLYRVYDPEVADNTLQKIISEPSPLREWDYRMEEDPGWELAQPELKLLAHDLRYN